MPWRSISPRHWPPTAVFVGEFVGGQVERVRTLAVFTAVEADDFEFELAGSAAAQIALGKPILCRDDAQRRCPSDTALKKLHAHAFAGVPLIPSEGAAPTGVLMAVYRKTVPNLSVAKSILEIFAPRAAAELERKQEHERLSESEQRYRAFVSLNCDGMWRIEFEQPVSTEGTEEQQLEEIYRYGYLAECNDALARQFGFERAEPDDRLAAQRSGAALQPECARGQSLRHPLQTPTSLRWKRPP